MEYHTYDSLFKVIKQQYPKTPQTKEDTIMKSLVDAYRVPTTDNLLMALKSATTPEEKSIEKDDIKSYIYVHR